MFYNLTACTALLLASSSWSAETNVTMASSSLSTSNVPLDFNISNHDFPSVAELQDKLVSLAEEFGNMSEVPYIWGGSRIGTREECDACRSCVQRKKTSLTGRLNSCEPCRRCGMDCSHFVNHLFNQGGLAYKYASSSELIRQSKAGLRQIYGMVDVGTDVSLAQPGDILVFPKHIALLVRPLDSKHGDIVHATRFREGDRMRLGGVAYDRNVNIKKFRGKLIRILRHHRLFESRKNFS